MQLRLRGARVLLAEDAIARDRAFSDEREFGARREPWPATTSSSGTCPACCCRS